MPLSKYGFPDQHTKTVMRRNTVTLEELANMTYDELTMLERCGDTTARKIYEHFHPDIKVGTLPTGERSFTIAPEKIAQYREFKKTWNYFGAETKEDFDVLRINNGEIAKFVLADKKGGRPTDKVEKGGKESTQQKERTAELEKRVREYLHQYDAPTPNDVAALRNLAFLNMEADILQKAILTYVGKDDPSSLDTVQRLNEQLVKISGETRQLELALGVLRRRRVEEAADPLEVLQGAMRDADWLLEQEIQEVVHNCKDNKVVHIMTIWHNFPTHPHEPIRQQCPNCGEYFVIEYKPRGIAVSAKDFEIEDMLGAISNFEEANEEDDSL